MNGKVFVGGGEKQCRNSGGLRAIVPITNLLAIFLGIPPPRLPSMEWWWCYVLLQGSPTTGHFTHHQPPLLSQPDPATPHNPASPRINPHHLTFLFWEFVYGDSGAYT